MSGGVFRMNDANVANVANVANEAIAPRIDVAGWSREATQGEPGAFFAHFEEAERLGFDGAWFHEFRLLPDGGTGPYPSPLLLAAALLARTTRLRVGISALVLPLHHPLLLAEEIAQLDRQGEGRLDVGLGRGTDAHTLEALQIDPAATRERFEHGARILRDALAGRAVASHEGPWRFVPQRLGVTPAQSPHPPLYVAGSSADTLAFALDQDLPLLLSLEPPEASQLGLLHAAAAQARAAPGRVAALLAGSSISRHVCVGRDADDAARRERELVALVHARRLHFARLRGVPDDQLPALDADRVLREQVIAGDGAACARQMRALMRATGVRQCRCVFNANGMLSPARALSAMTLFAREALPLLRDPAFLAAGD